MFKETRNFVKKHKYEIIFGTGFVIVGAALLYCKKDLLDSNQQIVKLTEIALNSLDREERRIKFEIQDIWDSIERLDDTKPINKFHKIPKRLARIEELEVDLLHIQKEKCKVMKR